MQTENRSLIFKKYWPDFLFAGIVVLIFFLNTYHLHFNDSPGGFHFIRQTDSLSFIDHYVDNGHNFFRPGTYNLESTNGDAACEFPIIYYIISFLYDWFGKHAFFLRGINFLISIIGLYNLFKLSQRILKDNIYALLVPLVFFSSTVYGFYIFNFLPDVAALGFIFIGLNLFHKQTKNSTPKWWVPFLFFTLAGLIKVTYFITPIALFLYFLWRYLRKDKLENFKLFSLLFLISCLFIFAWNYFIIVFNEQTGTHYFTTSARPFWALSNQENFIVWDHMRNYWYSDYFYPSIHHLILGIIVIQILLLFKTKASTKYLTLGLLILGGSLAYFILFFEQFRDHDYYALNFIPLLAALIINWGYLLTKTTENKWIHLSIKVLFGGLVLLGINYTRKKVDNRLSERVTFTSSTAHTIEKHTDEVQLLIPENGKVLILGDHAKNGSLYFLERYGWNLLNGNLSTQSFANYTPLGLTHIITCKSDSIPVIFFEEYENVFENSDLTLYKAP